MSLVEKVERQLDAIKKSKINAVLEVNPKAVEDARAIEKKPKKGKLAGKTIMIKANICVDGLTASCASRTLEDYVAPYEAHVISQIKKEDGIILGMANMDEFACGASGEYSAFGKTDNPKAPGRVAGGSSSGSAASVAEGLSDIALGSDTGGSIRMPANFCGVVSFKPTYGTVSRYGLIDMAMSLDQIGPLGNSVQDCVGLLDVVSGHDVRDSTSLDNNDYNFAGNLNPELNGRKIGYAREFDDLIADKSIRDAMGKSMEKLSDAGADIKEVSLPSLELVIPTYYMNVYVEFFSATRKFDGRRYGKKIEDVCGPEVLRRIVLGGYISQKEWQGKFYRKGLQARGVIRKELMKALKGVDVLAGPVSPKLPHKFGEDISDPRLMYAYDLFTAPVNLAGTCAGVVPASDDNGVPIGLQIIGKPLEDQNVLDVMAGFEAIG